MKINNGTIKLEMNGSLIDSIEYKGIEIINTTKNWTKKSPVLFPALASGKVFKIGEHKFPIPRHGYWNDINFNKTTSLNGIVLSGSVEHKTYPFNIDVDQYILLDKNKVSVTTTFTGPQVPMQFGYHPAFDYDKGGLKIKQDKVNVVYKDLTHGFENIDVNNISELDWENVDTFIFETKSLTLENNDYNLTVETNMKYIAVWTSGDKFICFEPWSNLPASVTEDDNVILDGQPFIMDITIKENK